MDSYCQWENPNLVMINGKTTENHGKWGSNLIIYTGSEKYTQVDNSSTQKIVKFYWKIIFQPTTHGRVYVNLLEGKLKVSNPWGYL